ncbi:MAG: hypothetical protein ACK5OS_02060 [Chryseotalea sp.]
MRKYILITLTDGTKVEREVPKELLNQIPIGAKANHITYLQMLQALSNGFAHKADDNHAIWIGSGYIQKLELIFEETLKVS